MKKLKNKLQLSTILKSGVFTIAAFLPYTAQAIILEVPIGDTDNATHLLEYIAVLYQFVVLGVVIAAVVMIMFAGLKWASAAGNSAMISDAKERIKGAFMGLAIALASFMILFLINPYLVSFTDLAIDDLEFDGAYTTDLSVIASGEICEDPNLVKYMEQLPTDLQPHLFNYAGLPCIQESLYNSLVGVLTDLDNAHPSDDYFGMKLIINGANRSYDSQKRFYDCWTLYGQPGLACPSECSASNCSLASDPGDKSTYNQTSTHGRGVALDVSTDWIGGKASTSYHKSCVVTAGKGSGCSEDIYNKIVILDELMQDNGFERICAEWWHFQAPGFNYTCPVGSFK